MAKIFITGGMGYLGSILAREAIKVGHEVCLYDSIIYEQDRNRMLSEIGKCKLIIGDTRNLKLLYDSIEEFEPNFVFHFGELSSTYSCDHNPIYTEDVNYRGSKNVMDVCYVKKIPVIYNSSSSIYSGKDNYTKYKLLMEEYVKEMDNVLVFRPATVFGLSPRFRIELLPNHFIYMALKGDMVISGSQNYRAAIDIDDLIEAYLRVIEVGSWKDTLYDIGHYNLTKMQFAEGIKMLTGSNIVETGKVFDTRNVQIDCSKFESEFGWKSKTPYLVSLQKIITWMKPRLEEIEKNNFSGMLNMPLSNWKNICS